MPRVVILGAGAIGCALGGMLQEHGVDVSFVARGAQLEALRSVGLMLATPAWTRRLEVSAVAEPAEVGFVRDDIVLLCTKTQDSEAALDALASAAGRGVTVACAQNGVENERLAARRFEHVLGMMVWVSAFFVEPGRVSIHSGPTAGVVDIGVHPEGTSSECQWLATTLCAAGFDARVEPRILRLKYGKLLTNLGNILEALAGRDARMGRLTCALEAEALACFEACAIEHAPVAEILDRVKDVHSAKVEGRSRPGGSTWQSLARGRASIETRFLNGEIVALGERSGVAVDVNRAVVRMAEHAVKERWRPGQLSSSQLREWVIQLGR